LFGWLILKETIQPAQMLGGAIVIAAGYLVIKEKGRLEELSHD
jgi:drug/metabolite transporter (DMT)-like permease